MEDNRDHVAGLRAFEIGRVEKREPHTIAVARSRTPHHPGLIPTGTVMSCHQPIAVEVVQRRFFRRASSPEHLQYCDSTGGHLKPCHDRLAFLVLAMPAAGKRL